MTFKSSRQRRWFFSKLRRNLKPGRVIINSSLGLGRGSASVSWKPPLIKRIRYTKRLY